LNRLYFEYLGEASAHSKADFCTYAAAQIPPGFDVIGLSTICSSYPLTLRLAKRLKQAYPDTIIMLGGPQASVVDVPTLRVFPFVDLIVRGEADEPLPKVLRTGLRSQALALVAGITFRSGGDVVRNPEGPVVNDLDALPFPAFDLLPGMESLAYFSLELGRGCPFSCSFCSTNDFFRRRFRLKSPEVVLAHMRRAKLDYRAKLFDLVHDMFTVDRKRVAAFCQTMLNSGEQFRWGCSARTDCIDDELIGLMYRAGCRSIFLGVETGSPRLQRTIDKDLDLGEAAARIRCCTSAGIDTTVSLITGFPEETEEDMWQTASFLVDAARHERVEPQLHIIAPLVGTPLYNHFRNSLLLDDLYSDFSYQGRKQDESDKDLIAAFPDIFANFYGVPAPALDRARLKHLRVFVLRTIAGFHWLIVALHQSRGGIRAVFEAWEKAFPAQGRSSDELEQYYASAEFRMDFVQFVRSNYLFGSESDSALEALLRLQESISMSRSDRYPMPASGEHESLAKLRPRGIVPLLRPEVRVVDLQVDIRAVFESLRRGDGLPQPSICRVTVATRAGRASATDIMELTPLSSSFLKLCDGRTLDQIAAGLKFDGELDNLGREQVAAVAFQELCRQRLLTWRQGPKRFTPASGGVAAQPVL
ncbi:MAG: B12-binding domain-containing radical SAM protein, partial [Acidobacteriaceae bacterium]|nr:B12-binding domain-containing radical SAM protein [Acidobacteriaceae bacterium]